MALPQTFALAVILAGASLFEFGQDRSVDELVQVMRDWSDPRPVRSILMVGNSRTSENDLPMMLRRIADSAHAPEKYQVLLLAPNGSSFQSLSSDWRVAREIGKPWDDAVFQGESRGQSSIEQAAGFMASGTNLLQAAHPRRTPPLLIVNWAYDRSEYDGAGDPALAKEVDDGRAQHIRAIQGAHAELARRTGAHAVNVGKVWEILHAGLPAVPLTSDGNHPTPAASYFVALCLYHAMSGRDVAAVSWAPGGVPAETAAQIRHLVDQYRSAL